MFKLDLEKAEEPEIELLTSVGAQKKAREFQKSVYFSPLTTPKSLPMWITTNCGKFLEMGIPDHLSYLLRNLYVGLEATVRTLHGTTDCFNIGKA